MIHKLNFQRLILIVLLGGLFLGNGVVWAQEGLTVTISTERIDYHAGERVLVTYTLNNQTGQAIQIKGSSCIPVFGLLAFDFQGKLIWDSSGCPSCCCTCCQCPIFLFERDIFPGETVYREDTPWSQIRTLEQGGCFCVTAPVEPGFYFLVGQVLDTYSDPILIQIF